MVTGVSTGQDCCLGDGYWFEVSQGQCFQCIGEYWYDKYARKPGVD